MKIFASLFLLHLFFLLIIVFTGSGIVYAASSSKSGNNPEVKQAAKHKMTSDTEVQQLRDSLAESEKWRKKYEDLVTGAFVENETRNMTELQTQQKLLKQLAIKERSTRNWSIGAAAAFIIIIILTFYQFHQRRQTRDQLKISQLQSKVLHSQLNPHFIFNALASIRRYIQQHPELAESYLSKFSTLMRQVLENSREERISLQEETATLENYMQLETLRLPHGFDYEINYDESVDVANTMVPPMILQPVIENAIWHGLNPLNRRGKIILRFTENHDLLEARIEDDGVGLGSVKTENVNAEKKRSLGMQITRERIELLNRKSKSKGSLVQQLFEHGSEVKITIPL